jgi:hypothetical protein
MTRLIKYRCQSCGSTEVTFDATAEWDAELQKLVVSNTYDDCYCNSDDCQGAECHVAEFDAQTGEALGRAPGLVEYILKGEADAAWEAHRQQCKSEQQQRDRERQQEHIIRNNAENLAAAYQEIAA